MKIRHPTSTEPAVYGDMTLGQPIIGTGWFDLDANVPVNTIESVGPTGSGADNIWTALDNVPPGVDWIQVILSGQFRDGTTTNGTQVNARATGSSSSMTSSLDPTLIARWQASPDATYFSGDVVHARIPVDEQVRFDIRREWIQAANATASINMMLLGYGYNGVIT